MPLYMLKQARKAVSIVILAAFISTSVKSPAYAQLTAEDPIPYMPKPGAMVQLSPEYTPAYLKGIVIHPENALKFDFIIYKGDKELSEDQKKDEYTKLTKYFLASLAIPDDDQWVNLSPYEKDRIIKDDFGKTEMGRDLLAQDYMLKQITASLIYPEDGLGKKFWDKVYAEAQEQYGTTNIPVNTFNKVWILPDDALIYEKGNTAYVLRNHLRVMLEEDYLSLQKHSGIQSAPMDNKTHTIASKIIKEIVLPELEREINEDENFATVRQVFSGVVLAAWYKRALKESLLGRIYMDRSRVKGVDQDPKNNEEIYHQYLRAYKKGVFNFIKEDVDKYTNEIIPRKYFSGGLIVSLSGAEKALGHQVLHVTDTVPSGEEGAAMMAEEPKLNLAEVNLDESVIAAQAAQRAQAGPAVSKPADRAMTSIVLDDQRTTYTLERNADVHVIFISVGNPGLRQARIYRTEDGKYFFDNHVEITGNHEFKEGYGINEDSGNLTISWAGSSKVYVNTDAAMTARESQLDDAFFSKRLAIKRVRITWELGEAIRLYLDRLKEQKPEVKNFESEALEQKEDAGGISYIYQGSRWVLRGSESDYLDFLKILGADRTLFKDETLYKGFERLANTYLSRDWKTVSKQDTAMTGAAADETLQNLLDKKETVGAREVLEALLHKTNFQGGSISESDFDGFVDSVKNLQETDPSPALAHARDELLARPEVFKQAISVNGGRISDQAQISKPEIPATGEEETVKVLDRTGETEKIVYQEKPIVLTLPGIVLRIERVDQIPETDLGFGIRSLYGSAGYVITDGIGGMKGLRDGEVVKLGKNYNNGKASNGLKRFNFSDIEDDEFINISRQGDTITLNQVSTKGTIVQYFTEKAMMMPSPGEADNAKRDEAMLNKGGIDFNSANLSLQIKRDGRGVPLPISQQDLEHINIDGLIPIVINIKPAVNLPIFSELQNTPS